MTLRTRFTSDYAQRSANNWSGFLRSWLCTMVFMIIILVVATYMNATPARDLRMLPRYRGVSNILQEVSSSKIQEICQGPSVNSFPYYSNRHKP